MTEYYDAGDGADLGWANDEEVKIPEGLPKPFMWRILVMPVQPKTTTRSGIVLALETQNNEGHLQFVGKVAAVGPLAFRSWKLCAGIVDQLRVLCGLPIAGAPKVGDWVVHGRYTGQRCEFKGARLIMMNDDEVLAKCDNPANFKVYV